MANQFGQADLEAFLEALPNVQRVDHENLGYSFFFVGDDHRLPFASIATSDNEFDNVSRLDRDGVFRVNIGVGKAMFSKLLGSSTAEDLDYAALNAFMPHPHYSRQHFVCILNPAGENEETTRQLLVEAHSLAEASRRRRNMKKQ